MSAPTPHKPGLSDEIRAETKEHNTETKEAKSENVRKPNRNIRLCCTQRTRFHCVPRS
nr:MAG TPA: hypothetical protein [Bacteriophage sp.]